jgi:nucleoside-diphosphate-sugar epimerase
MKKVGIFGCGWLGKPLSLELKKEFDVECFSRETTADDAHFWQSDTLLIAMHTKDNYLKTLQKIAALTKFDANIILMSSTSVYKEFDGDVDESAAISQSSLIKEAEELLFGLRERVLVLRLGGLMGEDRVAGRWKSATKFQDGYVNYIHRDDVIAIIKRMLERGITQGIYNLVAPLHPSRLEIHQKNSHKFGVDVGVFEGFSKRRVLSHKLVEELGYSFRYPNPLEFWG